MMAQQYAACALVMDTTPWGDMAELARTLHTEIRLLGELGETLRMQREGVAHDDVEAVDDSVFRSHRVLRTLGEARRQRRALVERITGQQELPLRDWAPVFGHRLTPELRHACDRAQEAAAVVAREIEINRTVLRQALGSSNAMIRSLTGSGDRPVSYAAETAAPVESARGGVLIDREV